MHTQDRSLRRQRRFARWALLFFWGFALWHAAPVRAEVIRSFEVEARLNRDTSLDVTETIQMDFQDARRHGIYRVIPVRYDRHGGSYTLHLRLLSITDARGNPRPYQAARQGRDLNIRIGDPDVTVSGLNTYRIRYRVRRAVNFFEGAPEVYWNATGNEWPFPIERASARFFPPPGVSPTQVRITSYVGPLGARTPARMAVGPDHVLFSADGLAPGEGLTFVAGLPAGSVTPPSALQRLLWWLADWWPLVVFPLLTGMAVLWQWSRTGRDIGGGQAVAVEWSPPTDLSPAEVGTLVDEHCHMQDLVSTLVDLAARGYLKIQETPSAKFLFFSDKDYLFIKQKEPADAPPLLPHERKFLQGLFSKGDHVTLSSLKNRFYTHLPGIESAIYQSLTDKRLFTSNPDTTRKFYHGLGFLLIAGGAFGAFYGAGFGLVAYGVGAALSGVIIYLSARAMPSKTALGSRKLRECLGFRRFVALAEKDRIAVLARDDPTIFGRLLPYAMVLGVADQWADAFRDLLTQPPDWYVPHGYGPGYRFSPHVFVNDLGSGMHTMGSTFSSRPSSTAGGGGSGFSVGGGSGGGFGGGGGRSW